MSFFDRQGIPKALLQGRNAGQGNAASLKTVPSPEPTDEFEDDIEALGSFSFISVEESRKSFGMHRLEQLATREWLIAHGEVEKIKREFIEMPLVAYPTEEPENWAR